MTSINRAPGAARRRRARTVDGHLRADPELERRMGELIAALLEGGPLETIKFLIWHTCPTGDLSALVASLDAWLAPPGSVH